MRRQRKVAVVALADRVCGECVQQFVFASFDEKGADTHIDHLCGILESGSACRRKPMALAHRLWTLLFVDLKPAENLLCLLQALKR